MEDLVYVRRWGWLPAEHSDQEVVAVATAMVNELGPKKVDLIRKGIDIALKHGENGGQLISDLGPDAALAHDPIPEWIVDCIFHPMDDNRWRLEMTDEIWSGYEVGAYLEFDAERRRKVDNSDGSITVEMRNPEYVR